MSLYDVNCIIKKTDMPRDMQQWLIDTANRHFERVKGGGNIEKDLADCLKKEFDRNYDPTWECIFGLKVDNIDSYVNKETKNYAFVYFHQTSFLLFKSG